MRITGLDDIVLLARDLPAAAHFFEHGLGLVRVPGPHDGRVLLALGGGPRLALESAGQRPPTSGLTLHLQVEDPDTFAREALSRGLGPTSVANHHGWREALFVSPDGVHVRARRPVPARA